MFEIILLIAVMYILFKITGLLFRIMGKVLGCVFGIIGYVFLGCLYVFAFGTAIVFLPAIVLIGIVGLGLLVSRA